MGKNRKKFAILFSVMALTALLVVELYIMINDSQSYINMAIVAVIMLVLVYLLVNMILRQSEERQKKMEELYEDVFKSQKASYLLLRKHFTEIEKQIGEVRKEVKAPKDEIISIQKAIAKITISRSKENTDALMNSNDRMMEKVCGFENLLEQSNNELLAQQKEMLDEMSHELADLFRKMEKELPEQLAEAAEVISEPDIMPDVDEVEPEIIPTADADEDVITEPELIPAEDEVSEVIEEEEPMAEPEISADAGQTEEPVVMDDPNKMMSPDDIAALLAGMQSEPEPTSEPEAEVQPEPTLEPETQLEPEAAPEPVQEEAPHPKSALEALAKHPASEPEADDPNKMMGPDDIAALLASMQNEPETTPAPEAEVQPEPEAAPEPEVMPEPEAAPEPAPAPAADADPNRKMTPEEIAALFANT